MDEICTMPVVLNGEGKTIQTICALTLIDGKCPEHDSGADNA